MKWKNRIVRHDQVEPQQLIKNPYNWRVHTIYQSELLQGILEEVGWVQDVIVNETTGHLVDGHLRVELAMANGEDRVPVKYIRIDEAEEKKILAVFDPLAAMAEKDQALFHQLLQEVEPVTEELKRYLEDQLPQEAEESQLSFDNGNQNDSKAEKITCPKCGFTFYADFE